MFLFDSKRHQIPTNTSDENVLRIRIYISQCLEHPSPNSLGHLAFSPLGLWSPKSESALFSAFFVWSLALVAALWAAKMRSTHTEEERWRLHSLPFDVCTYQEEQVSPRIPTSPSSSSAILHYHVWFTFFAGFWHGFRFGTDVATTAMNFPQFFLCILFFFFFQFFVPFLLPFSSGKVLSLLPHTLDHLVATSSSSSASTENLANSCHWHPWSGFLLGNSDLWEKAPQKAQTVQCQKYQTLFSRIQKGRQPHTERS